MPCIPTLNTKLANWPRVLNNSTSIKQFITDIQEFYELTLLDDTKSIQQKTAETIRIANKWETDGVRREVPIYTQLLWNAKFLKSRLEAFHYERQADII